MVFWAVQPRSSPTRIGQHFSNFNQYISLISSDNVISQSPISSLLVHDCASKVKDFLVSESFPCKYRVRQARASRIMVLTRINSSWTDPGCQVFQPPFRPLNRAPNLPSPRKGKHRGKHRTSTVLTCQGRCLYTNIYIYIKIYMNNQTCITFVHTNNYWHTLTDMIYQ